MYLYQFIVTTSIDSPTELELTYHITAKSPSDAWRKILIRLQGLTVAPDRIDLMSSLFVP